MATFGTPTTQSGASPERPWLGLSAYTRETASYFYGRDREIDELYRRVRLEPLTLLYGKSGLGKTSLLGAGLLPRLNVEGWCPILIRLKFEVDAPPLVEQVRRQLAIALHQHQAKALLPLWQQAFHRDRRPCVDLQRPVLIFDQFEELYTLSAPATDKDGKLLRKERRAEVAELMGELAALVERRSPESADVDTDYDDADYDWRESAIRIVLALRDDYLHELERWKKLLPALMRNRVELRELRGPDALDAVLQPARKSPQPLVESEVAHAIVCFVAKRDPDTSLEDIDAVPPLLSLLCTELNARRLEESAPQITRAQLVEQADSVLERFYERSFKGMPDGVRRAIEDLLIDRGGRIREASSRDSILSEMQRHGAVDAEAHLAKLVDRRLLTIEERAGAPRVELTHDLLVPLVARSRERREAEERAQAERLEAERLAAHERERLAAAEQSTRQAKAAQRRALVVTSLMSGLTFVAGLASVTAFYNARMAKRTEATAQAGLEQAATRALGRAREQLELGDPAAYAAYLAESLSYAPMVARNEAAMALQQQPSPPLQRIFAHGGAVNVAVFSPDGTRVLTASDDRTARLWDAQTGIALAALMEHDGAVRSAVFSPDGTRVLTASADSTARVWDAQTGIALGAPLRHEGLIGSPIFVPDGLRVLTAGADGTVRLWDAATGVELGAPMRFEGGVRSAVVSPEGTRVLTVGDDKAARLWDLQTGAALAVPMQHESGILHAIFSPDGTRVITTSSDGTMRLWDAHAGTAIKALLQHEPWVLFPVFSPDGSKLLTVHLGMAAWLRDARTDATRGTRMRHIGSVSSAAFSPDAERVVTASHDGTARLWDASTGAELAAPMQHEGSVRSAVFSPDGTRVLTASDDTTARLWNVMNGAAPGAPLRHRNLVQLAVFSPEGTRMLIADYDNTVRLWDVVAGIKLGAPMRNDGRVRSAFVGPNGMRVLTTTDNDTAWLWDPATNAVLGKPIRVLTNVKSAVLSPDGAKVITASHDGILRRWDGQTGAELGEPMRHEDSVQSIAFSHDGTRVLTASRDTTARLWDAATGTELTEPMRHDGAVVSAAFSPDGTRLLTTSDNKTAWLWDAQTGTVLAGPMRHEGAVGSAAFSPDGTRVLTSNDDTTARLWDAQTGAELGASMQHGSPIRSANFNHNGEQVLTASTHVAQLWDGRTGAVLGMPMRHEFWIKSAVFSPDGMVVLTVTDKGAQFWDAQTRDALGAPMWPDTLIRSAAFSPDGARVLTVDVVGTARLWDAPTVADLGAESQKLAATLQALGGRKVADDGRLTWISSDEWLEWRKEAQSMADADSPFDQLLRWHLAERSTRTISPFSQITVPQHIEREIDWVMAHPKSSPTILREAYNLDPGHPLILLAMSVLEDRPDTKALWKRLSFPRFENNPRLAARAAEILLQDRDPDNARKAAEIALALSDATESDVAKARAVLEQIDASLPERTP